MKHRKCAVLLAIGLALLVLFSLSFHLLRRSTPPGRVAKPEAERSPNTSKKTPASDESQRNTTRDIADEPAQYHPPSEQAKRHERDSSPASPQSSNDQQSARVSPLPTPTLPLEKQAEAAVQERLAVVEQHLQGIALDTFDFSDEASYAVYQGIARELSDLANELEEIAKLELPPTLILRAKILRGDVFMRFAEQWEKARIEQSDPDNAQAQRAFAALALEDRGYAMGLYQEALDYAETQQLDNEELWRVRILLREWTTIVK
ncbi:MAG: hypothetical protein RBU37_11520 [Myxococcota bacterium]|nr:hypothetical protein [Myxococcota bacterium]